MNMLRRYILLFILLLQAGVGFAVPDRDSLMVKVIERGRMAFKELVLQNKLNDEKGLSSQNHYVLHINTADLIDGEIDKLDKEYIRQRKISYIAGSITGDKTAGDFLVPAGEDLDELEEKLRKCNTAPDAKIRTYLVTIDFIPMIYDVPGLDLETLMSYRRGDASGTENGDIAENAKKDATAILQGISTSLVVAPPENGEKLAFNTACVGMVNYRIYDRKRRYKKLQMFSWYSNLEGQDVQSYNLLVSKHLATVKGATGYRLIKSFIDVISENNSDFALLPSVKDKIMSVKSREEMEALLSTISANAYDQFTYEQRIYAVKMLASQAIITNTGAEMIVDLLSTANLEEDAGKLRDDLNKLNNFVSKADDAAEAEVLPAKTSELTLLHLLVNGISDHLIGDKTYTRLMQVFINIAKSSPAIAEDALDFYRDPRKLDRTIIWDKSYALELFAQPPPGTNSYDVTLDNKLDEVTITKSQLKYIQNVDGYTKLQESMREYAKGNNTFIQKLLNNVVVPAMGTVDIAGYYEMKYPPEPQWVPEQPIKLKAWQLVSFTNKSDIGLLATAVGESSDQNEHKAQYLPAIVLKYAADKELNQNVGKGVVMAFDVITLVTPVGELAYLGKVANYVYKGIEYGSKVTALGHLAVETGAIPPDSKLAAFIKDCYDVTNLLQLGSLGFTATNGVIARLSRAEATKFLRSFYGAEKEGLVYLMKDPEAVKQILRFKKEIEDAGIAAGYGKTWFKAIKDQVYSGISNTVAKIKDLKFLKTEGSGNLLKFTDGANQQVMHTMSDGTLVLDKTTVTFAEDARLVGTVDEVSIRTAENASEVVEDLMFVQRANKSVECIRGACFIAGTPVRTKVGLVPIEQIKEDDTVLGVKVANGDTTWQKVSHAFTKHASKLVRIITGRDTIFSTPEHPYLTENGWKSAADLKVGWRLRLARHAFATLTAVLPIDTSVTVYNFETSITHNYCIGSEGIVVHNSCEIFERLKSRIPEDRFPAFEKDFAGGAKGSPKANFLKQFDNEELSTDVWEILYEFPAIRATEELYQIRGILKRCSNPDCTALVKEIMEGKKGFGVLSEETQKEFRERFEAIMLRSENKGDKVTAAQMNKCLARLREAWAGEGIVARVQKISKLFDQYNTLTAEQKLLFAKDFAEAHPKTLERMADAPEFLAHWKTDRDYYLNLSYADMEHKDWPMVYREVSTSNPYNASLAKPLNEVTEDVVGKANYANYIGASATYKGRPGGVVVRFNYQWKTEPPLIDMFKRRLTYLKIIRDDAMDGGQLYTTLYKDVPLGKVRAADGPGEHAEVLAVNVITREIEAATGVKITTQSQLSHIDCMVRGNRFGSMCRCPHCFFILQGVNMIGNR
ncbi:polymorphic toxin-type HINT domain-containing protein [Chitinophaga ginsengisoli]|uniref:Intein/intein n=1 Tax=Chitinophaga ginsengisoli TaxID=363837 RepID=A0A2P8G9S8_9BACT|nr:polymorphic toxin-type HINT domain-containing protein [Chitinophaga ginsengisoli]PSL30721.1 intein/intein [Chitinophaga ginsengisoli]